MFEILPNLGDLISTYSHGMKQKLVIISALIHSPKLLVMDEPFVGLDPTAAFSLKKVMKELCKDGVSIFFSSHVLEVVEKLCDNVGIIKDGKLVKYGSVSKIKGDESLESVFMELNEK
jgi:ABC-2 type transport system ATP-binding protein